jgi:hypothetical protein
MISQRLYVSLATMRATTEAGANLTQLEGKRGDVMGLEIVFRAGGQGTAVRELTAGDVVKIAVKAREDWDGDLLALATATKQGTGSTTLYAAALNLQTTEMVAAFAPVNGVEPDDVDALLEISITDTSSRQRSTQVVALTVQNDLLRGDEASPVPATPTYPAADSVPRMVTTEDGLRAIPTDGVTWPPLVGLVLSDGPGYRVAWFRHFAVDALPAESAGFVYVPDDASDPDNLVAIFGLS